MKFRLISKDNGVGLTKDIAILKTIIESHGHRADFVDWQNEPTKGYDVNIFLELFNKDFLPYGEMNYLIPNPEWFLVQWNTEYIRNRVTVLTKTRDTERIFKRLFFPRVTYTGFTSVDMHLPETEKKLQFVHLPGKSEAKGTSQVIKAFEQMPDVELTIYSEQFLSAKTPNIKIHRDRLSDEGFRKVQNEFSFHLCPSIYEGFGHYINEAKSCGNVVITTNASPMNELITRNTGFAVGVDKIGMQAFATTFTPSVDQIIEAVRVCQTLNSDEAAMIGNAARRSYLEDKEIFTTNIIKALGL